MDSYFGKDAFFYHGMLRKYVGIFGAIFSDMYVQRVSDDGKKVDMIHVPIKYGQENAYFDVPQGEERETLKVARVLPALAFEIANLYKDTSRKTNPLNIRAQKTENIDGSKNFQFNKVPYNIMFDLVARTKNVDEMLQILEQIVPVFDGNLTITLDDGSEKVNDDQNIVIRLDEISMDDNYDDGLKTRLIEYKFTFEMKAYLYKRTQKAQSIKEIEIVDALDFSGV